MNIEVFIAARKNKGLSQIELAEGICTQTTLSRFENNGNVPNLKTLIKLCNRLDLPLGALFPPISDSKHRLRESMDQIEFSLITSEYDTGMNQLATIDPESLTDSDLHMQYFYLKSFLELYTDAPLSDVFFSFDHILIDPEAPDYSLYQLLVYTGTGMIYLNQRDIEKADFYFKRILDDIYTLKTDSITNIARILHILFQCSVYYAQVEEYDVSDSLIDYGISICADNHITYYLARLAYQQAENAFHSKVSPSDIQSLINDARAYAKINRNTILLSKIEILQKRVAS